MRSMHQSHNTHATDISFGSNHGIKPNLGLFYKITSLYSSKTPISWKKKNNSATDTDLKTKETWQLNAGYDMSCDCILK